ncbi:MAG: hypothetical protein AB8F94_10830 [Saprospiraceae bacterium]
MYRKEKSETLDKILKHLVELEKENRAAVIEDIAKLINSDFHTAFHLCDILINKDLIDSRDISSKMSNFSKDKLININSNGTVFIKSEGGFKNLFEIQETERVKKEQFENLQLKDLKNRVKDIEKKMDEQREFWTSSIERNKEQIPFFKSQNLIIWISLGLAFLSFLKSYGFFSL